MRETIKDVGSHNNSNVARLFWQGDISIQVEELANKSIIPEHSGQIGGYTDDRRN